MRVMSRIFFISDVWPAAEGSMSFRCPRQEALPDAVTFAELSQAWRALPGCCQKRTGGLPRPKGGDGFLFASLLGRGDNAGSMRRPACRLPGICRYRRAGCPDFPQQ